MKLLITVLMVLFLLSCGERTEQEPQPFEAFFVNFGFAFNGFSGHNTARNNFHTPVVNYPEDEFTGNTETIDGIINALYDILSGGIDEPRDWELFRSFFIDDARLIPTGRNADGEHLHTTMTPEQYISRNGEMIEQIGFVEREIARQTHEWGNIAQVFTSYEAFRADETDPFMRGINSIQLWNDGARWWIVTVMWEAEHPDNPLPPEFQ